LKVLAIASWTNSLDPRRPRLVDTLASGELDGDACLNLKSPSEPFFSPPPARSPAFDKRKMQE
jgi:hypothetical protein